MVRLSDKTDALESIYQEEGLKGTVNRCKNYITPLPAAYLSRFSRRITSGTDDRIYWAYIDPHDLTYLLTIPQTHFPVTGPNAVVGAVGGPWDRHKKPFHRTEEYISIKQYLVDGVPWAKTPKGRRRVRQNRSEERIEKERNRIDELAKRIREEGYVSQQELIENGYEERIKRRHQVRSIEIADEIFIGLGRHNDLIRLSGGRHRLAVAQLLDIDSIPAMLVLRHGSADLHSADIRLKCVTQATKGNANWRMIRR
jgi:hypothetical protein